MDYSQAIDYLDWHYIEKPDYVEPDTEDALAAVKETVTDLRVALAALVEAIKACKTVGDWWLLTSGDAFRQARALVGAVEGGDG